MVSYEDKEFKLLMETKDKADNKYGLNMTPKTIDIINTTRNGRLCCFIKLLSISRPLSISILYKAGNYRNIYSILNQDHLTQNFTK